MQFATQHEQGIGQQTGPCHRKVLYMFIQLGSVLFLFDVSLSHLLRLSVQGVPIRLTLMQERR